MEELLKRAEAGELDAIEEIANSYYRGKNGFPEDNEKALFWYGKALEVDPNNLVGLNGIGNIYYNGYGVPADIEKGVAYYLRAAALGYSKSQYNIASHYEDEEDPACIGWYEKAFENGESDAAFQLYSIYEDGRIVERNAKKSIEWLIKGAEAGDLSCQVDLASCYLSGESVERDEALAAKWMLAAAEGGKATAMSNLAIMYEKGDAVCQDWQLSDEWAVKAARNGQAKQILRHALFYADGDGIFPKSMEKAKECLRLAEEAGDGDSEYQIAHFYLEGTIVEKDYAKAMPHLEAAGKRGNKDALELMAHLGKSVYGESAREKFFDVVKAGADDGYYVCKVYAFKCLYNGDGVEKDEKEAVRYLSAAAKGNNKEALYLMGILNLTGAAVDSPSPRKARLGAAN